jgi:rsbT co-antagonist protein RsbR
MRHPYAKGATVTDQTLTPYIQALQAQSALLAERIERAISGSKTVYAALPEAERHLIAGALAAALIDALAGSDPAPLLALLSADTLALRDRPFADTQALFALTRYSAMDLLRPQIRAEPESGITLVDELGRLLGAVREAEVERTVRNAEQRAAANTAELRATLHRLEQSFLTSPLATLEADDQGIIRRWNPAAEQIFGWSAAEAIGKNAIELVVPGLAREHVEGIVGALLSGQAANSRNVNVRKDGSLITCQWYNAVLHDEHGNVVGWLSQTQDVTEQLAASEQLAQTAAYLQSIFGAMNDIVLIIDADGVYRDVAPTQPEMRHNHSAALLGRNIADLIGAEAAAAYFTIIRDVLATGEPRQHLYSFPGPGNIEQHFNATVSKISDDRVLWVARDISEQRQAAVELAALQEQVIEAQQAALRELSTPIIPISAGIIAMPLIGSIDTQRAQLVIDTLLQGVAEQRASAAILDITGVQVVDTQVANALLRAAQAVRLLGAQVIITGIRPEVAQTLVGLGLDLTGIITVANLQGGIQYALSRRK